jgi:uncharacterized protein YceH (UPF0502 family)
MRANQINKKISDMQYDAKNELRTLVNEKTEIEAALSSYQSELQQLYQKFAKTQIMQNSSNQRAGRFQQKGIGVD